MSRDPRIRLEDIAEACARVTDYLVGVDFSSFEADLKTQDAVIRQFEVIGEAIKSLPGQLLEGEPEVPWRKLAGFRDVLAHSYFAVDTSIVWDAATNHVPQLHSACLRLLDREI